MLQMENVLELAARYASTTTELQSVAWLAGNQTKGRAAMRLVAATRLGHETSRRALRHEAAKLGWSVEQVNPGDIRTGDIVIAERQAHCTINIVASKVGSFGSSPTFAVITSYGMRTDSVPLVPSTIAWNQSYEIEHQADCELYRIVPPRRTLGIYVASKASHALTWRQLRDRWADIGITITSSWIDSDGSDPEALWVDCITEASAADALVALHVEGEEWKGAFVEIGAALAHGRPVIVVGTPPGSWTAHPLVQAAETLDAAEVILVEMHARAAEAETAA